MMKITGSCYRVAPWLPRMEGCKLNLFYPCSRGGHSEHYAPRRFHTWAHCCTKCERTHYYRIITTSVQTMGLTLISDILPKITIPIPARRFKQCLCGRYWQQKTFPLLKWSQIIYRWPKRVPVRFSRLTTTKSNHHSKDKDFKSRVSGCVPHFDMAYSVS